MRHSTAALAFVLVGCRATKPHLGFVLFDDLGFDDFYHSGDLAAAWPATSKLAESSCVSVAHYYTQPVCTPTRSAFMTGRYPIRYGLQHKVIAGAQPYGLPLDEATLSEKLKGAGYATVGIGKWHLGIYMNASLPTRRGFDHWYGFWQGGETHLTHVFPPVDGPGILDLNDDEVIDRSQDGVYSAELFGMKAVQQIRQQAAEQPKVPLFLYLALQNVHNPLEAPEQYTARAACADIPIANRKTFCGMAAAADDVVFNVTRAFQRSFPDDDVVLVLGGDNGGIPGDGAAGSNCPDLSSASCLRGLKGTVYEGVRQNRDRGRGALTRRGEGGLCFDSLMMRLFRVSLPRAQGIRNNALVCSDTLLPSARRGASYTQGIIHVMDWHATFLELAGIGSAPSAKPLDGVSAWTALLTDGPSPRTEFLVNIDPVDPFGTNMTWAYRYRGCIGEPEAFCGDWKYIDTPVNASYYPPSTHASSTAPGSRLALQAPTGLIESSGWQPAPPGERERARMNEPDRVRSCAGSPHRAQPCRRPVQPDS